MEPMEPAASLMEPEAPSLDSDVERALAEEHEAQELLNTEPTGPPQQGRGVKGQYVYPITLSMPTEKGRSLGLRGPEAFSRQSFGDLVAQAYENANYGTTKKPVLEEYAIFLEPHESGEPHLAALVRSADRHKWYPIGEWLRKEGHVQVNFGMNIKAWADGVMYFCVASERKSIAGIDYTPHQWSRQGTPTPVRDLLPEKFRNPGVVRKNKLSAMQFLNICREHDIYDETELWAIACTQEDKGDKGLMTFLMEGDPEKSLAKAHKAMGAAEIAKRKKMTRVEILEEAAATACVCPKTFGEDRYMHRRLKEIVHLNNIDGAFQSAVFDALFRGRAKGRNIFTVGPSDSGKSTLVKSLATIFRCYKPPDPAGKPTFPLSTLPGKELILLNEFKWDERIISWEGFKDLLEGESDVTVSMPKGAGADIEWKGDAPVVGSVRCRIKKYFADTAREDPDETLQVDNRVEYFELTVVFTRGTTRKDTKMCKACAAKFYLEGRGAPAAPAGGTPHFSSSSSSSSAVAPGTQKKRAAGDLMSQIGELHAQLLAGVWDEDEYQRMKKRILEEACV